MVHLQALTSADVAEHAMSTRLREVVLPAERGKITTADGTILAVSEQKYTVIADQKLISTFGSPQDMKRRKNDDQTPRDVQERLKNLRGVAGAVEVLAPKLQMDPQALWQALGGNRGTDTEPDRYVKVAKQVDPRVWRDISQYKIPGLISEPETSRAYPAGPVAANVIGFVGPDGTGQSGIESGWNSILTGQDGHRVFERGRSGSMIPIGERSETEPVAGKSMTLTVRSDIQWFAQQAITKAVKETGAERGVVIVKACRTGDIYAIAESPTLDPNKPASYPSSDRGSWALSGVIEPGSTAKVITVAAAIEESKVTPTTTFQVPDALSVSGETFNDSHKHAVENLTVAGILAKSSNTGTVMLADKMSKAERYDYLRRFGLGQYTGVGARPGSDGKPDAVAFPGESAGVLRAPEKWDRRTQYAVMFGQGLSVNALQIAQVYSTIGNDGVRPAPRLVASVGEGESAQAQPRGEGVRVVSSETASKVISMLESAVEDGTGENAKIPGYRVAGKTGTAEAPAAGGYRGYTASFVGMAPADDPQLVVAVILQRPVNGYYGGAVAAPVFKEVMTQALAAMRIAPSTKPAQLYPLSP